MSQVVSDFFNSYKLLGIKELAILVTAVKLKQVRLNEFLVKEGELKRKAWVVINGLLRTYTLKSNGDEVTQLLVTEKMAATAYRSFLLNQPSNENIHALESSLVIEIDLASIEELSKKHLGIALLQNKIVKESMLEAIERITFYTTLSAEERFLHLQANRPDLLQRVPQKYLSSFLGITPVSFSRMKARVFEKR